MIFTKLKALALWNYLYLGLVLLFLFLLSSTFFLVTVDSRSMEPTLSLGDKVLVLHKSLVTIETNDILLIYPENDQLNFPLLKRVRALPEDLVEIRDEKLYVNHVFVQRIGKHNAESLSVKLSPNEYFIMGDWSDLSMDSRNFGPISYDEIKGKVIYIP